MPPPTSLFHLCISPSPILYPPLAIQARSDAASTITLARVLPCRTRIEHDMRCGALERCLWLLCPTRCIRAPPRAVRRCLLSSSSILIVRCAHSRQLFGLVGTAPALLLSFKHLQSTLAALTIALLCAACPSRDMRSSPNPLRRAFPHIANRPTTFTNYVALPLTTAFRRAACLAACVHLRTLATCLRTSQTGRRTDAFVASIPTVQNFFSAYCWLGTRRPGTSALP